MAELRRLHRLCRHHGLILDIHHLPSVLNLYADRLSWRRGVVAYLPTLEGVADHWWVGESEHDLKLDWGQVELLRPPLEIIPQVPRKVQADQFEGLLLLPYWERQNWHQGLVAMSDTSQSSEPSPGPGKRWRATLLAFSPAAKTMTERHGWLPTASSASQTDSQ
jgi:hypothetical protein